VPQPKPEEDGEISFTLDLPQGSGNGTSSSPVVVKKGETLNMTISQRSSYTDPSGTVFTCEPEAVIKLFAKQDTIVARDLKELTEVKGGSDVKTHKTGTSPVLNQTVQTFDVGGQNIVFDLSHEIYSYITSTKDKIEMPYVKLNQARLGGTGATEEKPQGRSVAVVAGVTVRPLTTTRGPVLRDSTMYEVNVRFSLDLEGVHTKRETRQTLEFSVNYVGIVETVTELPDPVAEVSYTWEVKSGTTGTASPFVKTKGETPMEIWMAQSCSYTDEYGNKITGEPKAKIKFSVAQDTVWTKTLDELKTFAAKDGEKPSGQAAAQKFGSDLQEVAVEWSYEAGEAVIGETSVPLPFYALEPVALKGVSVKELSDGEEIGGKMASLYEVTATFSQKATAKNVENVSAEVPDVEIEYVVNYVGAVELTLKDVEYIPSGEWTDPHHNLRLAYHAKVERYRTYSNGKRVGPDVFYDYGHPARPYPGNGYELGRTDRTDDIWYVVYPETLTNVGDSIVIESRSFQFSKILGVRRELFHDGLTTEVAFKDWSGYELSARDDDSLSVAKDFDNPDYPADNRPSGWYYQLFMYKRSYKIHWKAADNFEFSLISNKIVFDFYDQFLVVDGRRIDFSELHNLKMDFSHSDTDFSDAHKEGKVAKLEMRVSYLGKNFYAACIDSLYVAK